MKKPSRLSPSDLLSNVSAEPSAVRARVEAMETLLESSIPIPVINIRIGLDSVIGLVPVVGDLFTAAMGSWLIWEAKNLGMSKWQLGRMAANVGFDTVLGMVPFLGDAADVIFRSNSRNMRIIKKHLDKHHPTSRIIDQ